MSKPITIGQSHNVISILANNVNWDALAGMGDVLQTIIDKPIESGKHFTLFLRNGGNMIFGSPIIIPIDRSQLFDPIKFLGNGWSIEEQDEHSLALTQLDIAKIRLEHMLQPNENRIGGEEKLGRLKKAGYVRLDAKVFQAFWENQMLIPEYWKEKTNGNVTSIFFDGTILLSPSGGRYVLCLYWSDGQWDWDCYWLGSAWSVSVPSAVLASI